MYQVSKSVRCGVYETNTNPDCIYVPTYVSSIEVFQSWVSSLKPSVEYLASCVHPGGTVLDILEYLLGIIPSSPLVQKHLKISIIPKEEILKKI